MEQVKKVCQNNQSARKRRGTALGLRIWQIIDGLGVKPLSISRTKMHKDLGNQMMQPQLEAKDLWQFNQILRRKELARSWCRIAISNQTTRVEPVELSEWPRLPKPTTKYTMARSA